MLFVYYQDMLILCKKIITWTVISFKDIQLNLKLLVPLS